MASTSLTPILANLFGPIFFGVVFNWMLFGILIMEAYFYYISFPNDRHRAKGLVVCIMVLEGVQTSFVTSATYRIFASGFGDIIGSTGEIDLAIGVLAVTGGCLIAIVQIFFAWRLYLFGKALAISSLITTFSLVQCGLALAFGVQILKRQLTSKETVVFDFLAAWLACAALCDIIITVSMTYFLKRSLNGSHRSSPLLSRLIRLTIQSGLICSSGAIITLILSQVITGTDFVAPTLMLTKLYSINLLAILNSRIKIVGGRIYEPVGDMGSNSLGFLTKGAEVTLTPFDPSGEQNQHTGLGNLYLPMDTLQTNSSTMSVTATDPYVKVQSPHQLENARIPDLSIC